MTDLLPYEKGNHFTHRYLYEYIQQNKKYYKKSLKNILKRDSFFSSQWHSAPHQFKITKKNNDFRVISLINPLGLIQSLLFIEIFETDIMSILQNQKDFSARKSLRRNDLVYKKDKNQTVYYSDGNNSKKQLLISLESSGTYFHHKPYKSITTLRNSGKFEYMRDKYQKLLTIDIQNCFPSIYSHSFKWLISNKVYDSRSLSNANNLYSNIDQFLQNINGSKTNGIIVGPEISRLLAEFLMIHIDAAIINELEYEGIRRGENYEIFRFVDDFYIFSDEDFIQDKIKETISNVLDNYHLKFNDSKMREFGKSDVLNKWYLEIGGIISAIEGTISTKNNQFDMMIKHFDDKELLNESEKTLVNILNSLKSPQKNFNYANLKGKVNLIIEKTDETALISSYLLSTILKKVEGLSRDKDIKKNELNKIIKFSFFLYSKKITYSSTQKLIRILTVLLDINDETNNVIEKNIERFNNEVFTNYPSDWIDLLLFFSSYNLNLSLKTLNTIEKKIFIEENPNNIAALSLLINNKKYKSRRIENDIKKTIEKNVRKINWNEFFQDKHSWWVYIFYSYPQLEHNLKVDIKNNLLAIKVGDSNKVSDHVKNLIIQFLLEKNLHFIEWEFAKENYYKDYFFYTKDRTVFNPDIIEQINITS